MPEVALAPPAAAPAAPAAPAASTPAAAPSAAPATSGKPVSRPANNMADAYAQLDAMGAEPDAPAAPPKPEDSPDPQDTPGDDTPATDPNQRQEQQPRPMKAAELKQNYERLKSEMTKREARIAELETKLKTPAEDPERKRVEERLTAAEKRATELDEELRFSNYERSTEYKEKYEAPFHNAYQQGRNKAASLKVTDIETGQARQGTAADFDAIARMTDDDAAAELANTLFGNKSAMVLFHRERVQELNGARVQALDEFRKNGGEREKQRAEMRTKQQTELATAFSTASREGVEKYPQWLKPVEGDTKGAEILANGMRLADIAFGTQPTDANGSPITISATDRAKLHAAIRNKAGGFDHVVHLLNQQKALNKELKTKLKQFESSEPGAGQQGRQPQRQGGSAMDGAMSALDKLAR